MKKLERTFVARGDDGRQYTVEAYRSYTRTARDISTGESSLLPGLLEYRLSSGFAVNQVDDRTFEVVESGLMIRIQGP